MSDCLAILTSWSYQLPDWDDVDKLPTEVALERALHFASLVDYMRVLPNGDGGIIFEDRYGLIYETLEVEADGSAELIMFEHGRIIQRRKL